MRTKASLGLLVSVMVLVLSMGVVNAYVPRSGVLSPDEVDFGGKTVRILTHGDWTVHRGGVPEEERVAEAEELFNVKIEVMEGVAHSLDYLMSRIMAGDSTYDVIKTNHRAGYFPLVSGGMLYPVSDLLPEEYFAELPNADQHAIDKLAYKGDYYGFGVSHGVFNNTMMLMRYNIDLIEEAGLEDPYELWLDGKWDWEALEKIAVALTKDTDGDGVIDQFGFTDINNAAGVYRFIPFNGAEIAKQDENGKWVYALNEPEAINAINMIARWRNELNIMGSGSYEQVALVTGHLSGMRHALAAGINLGYVPYPKGPDVDEHQWPVFDFFCNFLPINSAYPEGMIALVEFLYREDDSQQLLDDHINSYMKTREQLDVYMTGTNEWQGEGDVFQNSGLWDITNSAVVSVINGEKGAAAAVDEVAQQTQAYLDDLFGQ